MVGSPSLFRGNAIVAAIAIIASANHLISVFPSICLANSVPNIAPNKPARPKAMAQGHLTMPARPCIIRPIIELTVTAEDDGQIATCVAKTRSEERGVGTEWVRKSRQLW